MVTRAIESGRMGSTKVATIGSVAVEVGRIGSTGSAAMLNTGSDVCKIRKASTQVLIQHALLCLYK